MKAKQVVLNLNKMAAEKKSGVDHKILKLNSGYVEDMSILLGDNIGKPKFYQIKKWILIVELAIKFIKEILKAFD
jgi:hypothetical protein